jgi:hypothetical protein
LATNGQLHGRQWAESHGRRQGGIAVEEREVASHFSDYYRTLWNASTPLEKLLTDQSET